MYFNAAARHRLYDVGHFVQEPMALRRLVLYAAHIINTPLVVVGTLAEIEDRLVPVLRLRVKPVFKEVGEEMHLKNQEAPARLNSLWMTEK